MANAILKECSYCGNQYTYRSSGNKYCSYQCRFLEISTKFNGVEGCWEWPRSLNVQTGYGQFSTFENGKPRMLTAHRVSYETMRGNIDEGMYICHTCDNRKCFNPSHLFQGTQKENIVDMMKKGRFTPTAMYGKDHWARKKPELIRHGSKSGNSKLNEDAVLIIRSSKETSTSLAIKYGVTTSAVCYARKRLTWKHI